MILHVFAASPNISCVYLAVIFLINTTVSIHLLSSSRPDDSFRA